MSTETLKIDIVQKVLGLSDEHLLEKINDLLSSETIVGFEINGTPVTQKQLLSDIDEVRQQIETNTLKTYSSDEVRRHIFGK